MCKNCLTFGIGVWLKYFRLDILLWPLPILSCCQNICFDITFVDVDWALFRQVNALILTIFACNIILNKALISNEIFTFCANTTNLFSFSSNEIFFNFKIFEIICWKSQILKKLQKREKILNWWKPRSFLLQGSPPFGRRYPIIDNISISHWWNITFPYYCHKKEKSSRKCCKRSHYVRGLKSRKFTKEVVYIYPEIS